MKNPVLFFYPSVYFFRKIKIKAFCLKVVLYVQRKLIKLYLWLNKDEPIPNPLEFEDLAPSSDAEKNKAGMDALLWALRTPKIQNIAVSGPYGSGKSSLLKTFESQNPEYHYLNISLANFNEDLFTSESGGQSMTPEQKTERNRLVELSILQQIFYRVKSNRIPDSRFNRIKKLSARKVIVVTMLVVFAVIGFLLLTSSSFFDKISWWKTWRQKNQELTFVIGLILGFPAVIRTLTLILRMSNSSGANILIVNK